MVVVDVVVMLVMLELWYSSCSCVIVVSCWVGFGRVLY